MTPRIDGRTGVYAVLGHPVTHSLSPAVQNAAFLDRGLNAVYVALDVAPDGLDVALRGLHALGVRGLNLTTPHKEPGWRLVSQRSEEAARARAVNTLRWEEDGWHGDATDGRGMERWLDELAIEISGRTLLLLGTGGAARSVGPALLERSPARIVVAGGDGSRAARLADSWRSSEDSGAGATLGWADLRRPDRRAKAQQWDLIVRARSAIAIEESERLLWSRARAGAVVLDLNYGERAAGARQEAHRAGLRFEDGLGLLVHQGACSFEFWTGLSAPVEAMRRALTAA